MKPLRFLSSEKLFKPDNKLAKIFIVILLPFISCSALFSQTTRIVDSVMHVIETDISDKQRVDAYLHILDNFYLDYDKAIAYGNKAIEIAKKINYAEGECEILYLIGFNYMYQGDFPNAEKYFYRTLEIAQTHQLKNCANKGYFGLALIKERTGNYFQAIDFYNKSLIISQEIADENRIAKVYNGIGTAYKNLDNYPLALENYLKSLDLRYTLGDQKGSAIVLNNIGIIYRIMGDYDKALKNFFEAIHIIEDLGEYRQLDAFYNNIGNTYGNLGDYDKSLEYHLQSLEECLKKGDKLGLSTSYANIGNVHVHQEKFDLAINNYDKAIQIAEDIGAKRALINPLNQKGEILLNQNKVQQAKNHHLKALAISNEIQSLTGIQNSALRLSDANLALGDYKGAYESYKLYKESSDSIINNDVTKKVTRLNDEFEFKLERDSIQFANNLQRLSLEEKIKVKSTQQSAAFISLALFGLLIIVLYRSYYLKKKDNIALSNLNQEVKLKQQELEKINDSKNRLFSIIGHDIKGPMNNFLGVFDYMTTQLEQQEKSGNEQILQLSYQLKEAGEQVLLLLENLLIWANNEQDLIKINPEHLDLKQCVVKTVKSLSFMALQKDITIKTEIENSSVFADKNSLMVVIRNLLNNAIKFTPKGGEIKITASTKNHNTQIKIKDTGVGIAPEKLPTIFDLNSTKVTFGTDGEKGTGLGLSMVKSFVTQNNGQIAVESEPDKGSTFIVQLPLSE